MHAIKTDKGQLFQKYGNQTFHQTPTHCRVYVLGCAIGEFLCAANPNLWDNNSKQCFPNEYNCDGYNDCEDGRDENGCSGILLTYA